MSIDHWLISQAYAKRLGLPKGLVNAGWNQLIIPRPWNTWLGFAPNWGRWPAAQARLLRLGIQVGLPSYVAGAAYGGWVLGDEANN